MIGLDTNVLVRYLAQDDPDQASRATRLIESLDEDNQGFVSVVTLVELHWVLRRAYKASRADAAAVVRKMLEAKEISLQEPEAVRLALAQVDADFADALIAELGARAGCSHTATFDERATHATHMRLVPPLPKKFR